MTETGWPLIPREVLPAPVQPAKVRPAPRPVPPPDDAGRQLSIFGAESTEPSPADLAGLLAGPGRLGRMGGTARVTLRVDEAWRVHVLNDELTARGLVVTWALVGDGSPASDRNLPDTPELEVRAGTPATYDPDAEPLPDLPSDVETAAPEESTVSDQQPSLNGTSHGSPDLDGTSRGGTDHDGTDHDGGERHDGLSRDGSEQAVEDLAIPDEPSAVNPDSDTEEPGSDTEKEGPATLFEVRTAYSSRLNALAKAWPDAAQHLFLSGPRLRLWVAAAGRPVPNGYALGLDPSRDADDPAADTEMIDAALVRAGLAGRVSADGRRYVITGRRRLKRLAELVGEPPGTAPEQLWPSGAGA